MSEKSLPEGSLAELVDVRFTQMEDAYPMKEWLMDPQVQSGFPMTEEAEVIDAVNRWMSFCRYQCSLTAVYEGKPCGIATLYLNPYKTLRHQSEMGIVVAGPFHGKGVGTTLMRNLMHMAVNKFSMEYLHLTARQRAVPFYKKFGFEIFGEQPHWGRNLDGSEYTRYFMQVPLDKLDAILAKTGGGSGAK